MPDRAHPFAAIVLAAGLGTRFGEPKAEARLPTGERFVDRVAALAREAGADPVVAVVAPGVTVPDGVRRVENARGGDEQIASLRLGLVQLVGTPVEGALVWPVDHPLVALASVLAVVDAFRRTGAPVVVPTHEGRRGHPAFFARESWQDVMTVQTGGARAVVRAYGARVHEEPVADAAVVHDIDTRSDMPLGGRGTSNALS